MGLVLLSVIGVLVGAPGIAPATASADMTFGFNIGAASDGDSARAAADIKPGGIVRIGFEWSAIQTYCWNKRQGDLWPLGPPQLTVNRLECVVPGPYDWTAVDNRIKTVTGYNPSTQTFANDVEVLPVVYRAPQWAWGVLEYPNPNIPDPKIMPPGDDNTAQEWWQFFVQDLVTHMKAQPYWSKIVGLEVWNEENGNTFWSTNEGPSPERYARVLCRAYSGTKWVAPSLPVIMGGLGAVHPEPNYTDKMTITDFLDAAYVTPGLDLKSCMNSMGVHPYPAELLPTGGDDPPDQPGNNFVGGLDEARQAASRYGDANRKLSITEFGYFVGHVTPQQQADYELRAYDIAAGMSDVDMFLVHSLYQSDGSAICLGPNAPRPAATAFKQRFRGGTEPAFC